MWLPLLPFPPPPIPTSFINHPIAAFKSLTQILARPALGPYPTGAVLSDLGREVLAVQYTIREILLGVLQGDKQEGDGALDQSKLPALPDPHPFYRCC